MNRKNEQWREMMPENYAREQYGRHINNERMYRDAVRNLNRADNKGNGEHWQMDDIIRRSDVDFNRERFTPYDYAYMVNALHADYPDISERPEQYMQMANRHLHNDNFPERGDERAYYDYQNRSRQYNNNYNYRSEYNYENRYDGYNYRNSNKDRDNDGRYYE